MNLPRGNPGAEAVNSGRVTLAKAQLRTSMRAQLQRLTTEQRAEASASVCRRLGSLGVWCESSSVLVYAPRADEVDICPLITDALEKGKQVALPRYDPGTATYRICRIISPICELTAGQFGIPEPAPSAPILPLKQLDLILVPGLAFDLAGHRLGRGRGFYDLLLAGVRVTKCGLGFDEQVKSEIPVATHDILLDCILTPTRWLVFGPRRSGDDLVG